MRNFLTSISCSMYSGLKIVLHAASTPLIDSRHRNMSKHSGISGQGADGVAQVALCTPTKPHEYAQMLTCDVLVGTTGGHA